MRALGVDARHEAERVEPNGSKEIRQDRVSAPDTEV